MLEYIISLSCPFAAFFATNIFEVLRLLILIECIKRLTRGPIFRRPTNAHNCGIFCENDASKSGFPSGHMAITAFLVNRNSPRQWLWLCAMAWARRRLRCHTVFQIVSGALIGLAWKGF